MDQLKFELINNLKIIENSINLEFKGINKGLLIVYCNWSEKAISNITKTLELIKKVNYFGDILIIDIDKMPPNFQINLLGTVCNGWGELFEIENGKIINKFKGKDCYIDFERRYKN